MRNLKYFGVLFVASQLSAAFAQAADAAVVTPLMQKELADIPGKEVLVITVVYPPGSADPVRRNASSTKPAKFLVFLLKNKGADVLVPAT
jgi:hypothetical protein